MNYLLLYITIGLAYTLINVLIRKMDNDDPMLAIVWLLLWPLPLTALLISLIYKLTQIWKMKP